MSGYYGEYTCVQMTATPSLSTPEIHPMYDSKGPTEPEVLGIISHEKGFEIKCGHKKRFEIQYVSNMLCLFGGR